MCGACDGGTSCAALPYLICARAVEGCFSQSQRRLAGKRSEAIRGLTDVWNLERFGFVCLRLLYVTVRDNSCFIWTRLARRHPMGGAAGRPARRWLMAHDMMWERRSQVVEVEVLTGGCASSSLGALEGGDDTDWHAGRWSVCRLL